MVNGELAALKTKTTNHQTCAGRIRKIMVCLYLPTPRFGKCTPTASGQNRRSAWNRYLSSFLSILFCNADIVAILQWTILKMIIMTATTIIAQIIMTTIESSAMSSLDRPWPRITTIKNEIINIFHNWFINKNLYLL